MTEEMVDSIVEEYVAAFEDLHHLPCSIERNGSWYRVNKGQSRFRVSKLKCMSEELRRRKMVEGMVNGLYFSRFTGEQLLRLLVNEQDRLKTSTEEYERAARGMALSKTRISEMSLVLKEKYGVG